MQTLIIGLDCASPKLLNKWKEQLPYFSRLMDSGVCGSLESCHPPITVPAWSVMFSGKTPGELGVYGFRNRLDYSYDKKIIADGALIKHKRLWDWFSYDGQNSIIVGVPQTHPVYPIKGLFIPGIPLHGQNLKCYPPSLSVFIQKNFPDYQVDVDNFRNRIKEQVLSEIYKMTKTRFQLMKKLLQKNDWNLAILVEIGLDRIQHLFWQYMDENSLFYEKDSPYKNVVFKYYQLLDILIADLLNSLNKKINVLIVSDHGARPLMGVFRINEWLIKTNYLSLKSYPDSEVEFSTEMVDWENTVAWSDGGYYARIYFNLKGREQHGILERNKLKKIKSKLKSELENYSFEPYSKLKNKVLLPEEIYPETNAIAPDLILYPADLSFRASAGIGGNNIISFINDTGPDGANHDRNGVLIMNRLGIKKKTEANFSIYDIAPSILKMHQIESEETFRGKSIV